MSSFGVALVGYGLAGKVFHAPLIRATNGLDLKCVVTSRREEMAADLPDVPVVADLAAALATPGVDLVVIATPDESHHTLAAEAIAARTAVVIDKPFAITLAEARDLAAKAAATGDLLSVFHNRRWASDFLTVRKLIDDGTLGEIVHYEARFDRWRPVPRERWREVKGRGSGVWHDLGSHLIDQALQLFGPPLAIWADIRAERAPEIAPDYFHAVLRYPSHEAVLHAGSRTLAAGPTLAVHGTRASYVKHGLDPQEAQSKAGMRPGAPGWGVDPEPGRLTTPGPDGATSQSAAPSVSGDYGAYYRALRDALAGKEANPVPPKEALMVMTALELGLKSARERREVAWTEA